MVAGVGYTLKTPIELSGEPTYGAFKVLHSKLCPPESKLVYLKDRNKLSSCQSLRSHNFREAGRTSTHH